jgi:hypothetical protein
MGSGESTDKMSEETERGSWTRAAPEAEENPKPPQEEEGSSWAQ